MSDESPTPEEPVAEDQTALSILKDQVTSLTAKLQELTSERDEFRESLRTVADERDSLKTQIGNPDDAAKELVSLKQQIRDRNHFDKFSELAKGEKAKEAALKHLWTVSGYKAEADQPDEAALRGILKKLKTEADYAFDVEPIETRADREARVTSRTKYGLEMRGEEPAGGGRGGRAAGQDGTIVTAEMRADPKFMLDPKNREIIGAAAREGRFR